MIQSTNMLCEYIKNPMGIDNAVPVFSWICPLGTADQAAYRIIISDNKAAIENTLGNIWDTGKVESMASANIPYKGKELRSRTKYWWRVKMWDSGGHESAFSEMATFETAMLDKKEWQAQWIGPSTFTNSYPIFRRTIDVKKNITQVRVYISGLSCYELKINGRRVGSSTLVPVWTEYEKRVAYNVYDGTEYLCKGRNVVAAEVGMTRYHNFQLFMQINISYDDGCEDIIGTDREGWGFYPCGPRYVRDHYNLCALYGGEFFNEEKVCDELDNPNMDTRQIDGMLKPMIMEEPGGVLVAQVVEPIQAVAEIRPVSVTEPKKGVYVVDFGKIITGWVRLRVLAEEGQTILVKHGEILYEDGTVNMENLRRAMSTDEYVLARQGEVILEPKFTYHGFRFVQIEGVPVLFEDMIKGIVARNAVPARSEFNCSDDRITKIHDAVVLTEGNNLLDVPTDCPQRDERLGWTNDATSRAEESIYNYDLIHFYRKWMDDIQDTQGLLGSIADTAPYVKGLFGRHPADATASSFVLIPWLTYLHYGDKKILSDHYEGIKAWVTYKRRNMDDGIVNYCYYGDWVSPRIYSAGTEKEVGGGAQSAITPGVFMSTGFYIWENILSAGIAKVLGKDTDARIFEEESRRTADVFNRRYLNTQKGFYATGSQACQILPLYLGIVPKEYEEKVVDTLVRDIIEKNYHISTGNQCTKMILPVLSDYGYTDMAYRILIQRTYPSWLFMLDNGGTTIWERWEILTGNGMNSYCHPVLGSIDAWFYRYIAGIAPEEHAPGFERFRILPHVPDGLNAAEAKVGTIRGDVVSRWHKDKNIWNIRVQIPWNSAAQVFIPLIFAGQKCAKVSMGTVTLWQDGQILLEKKGVWIEKGRLCVTVGSGVHDFTVTIASK